MEKNHQGRGEENFAYVDQPSCLHFKANWHDESQSENYYAHWRFRYWVRLFASGQMPACLQLDVANDMTEQESIWTAMSSEPQGWNKKIRTAIGQVIDLCALQGNFLAEELLTFNEEFKSEPLPLNPSFGYDFFPLIESFKQMRANQKLLDDTRTALAANQNNLMDAQNDLMGIKRTLTWRLYEYLVNIYFVRKVYLMIVMPIRRWRSAIK